MFGRQIYIRSLCRARGNTLFKKMYIHNYTCMKRDNVMIMARVRIDNVVVLKNTIGWLLDMRILKEEREGYIYPLYFGEKTQRRYELGED